MKLIKKLGTKVTIKGSKESLGIFLCLFCLQEVIRRLSNGLLYKSCGCNKIKHGGKRTKLYKVYLGIKQRILNQNNTAYHNYGGRGIKIYSEWLDKDKGFIMFRDWSLNNGYQEGLEIDRIDNNGNYEPNNCRWVTSVVNSRNRRNNKININIANEIRSIYNLNNTSQRKLSVIYNVSQRLIFNIINNKSWLTNA